MTAAVSDRRAARLAAYGLSEGGLLPCGCAWWHDPDYPEDGTVGLHRPGCKAVRACRVCGCTDELACENGCCWVAADLCSNCRPPVLGVALVLAAATLTMVALVALTVAWRAGLL